MNAREVDLDAAPDPTEVRLVRDGCIVSIWLPAPLDDLSEVMRVLAKVGFEFWRDDQ